MQLFEVKNLGKSIDGATQDRRFPIVLLAHNLGVHLCTHVQKVDEHAIAFNGHGIARDGTR